MYEVCGYAFFVKGESVFIEGPGVDLQLSKGAWQDLVLSLGVPVPPITEEIRLVIREELERAKKEGVSCVS